MATTTYLVITDGTTTCTFADGAASPGATNYEVAYNGWSPAVAGLRRSALGGRGPYEDVVETMQINVTGSSAANALANLQTLTTLIDQAQRWSRGENVTAVTVNYSPGGATVSSTGTPLKAVILGYAPGETRGVTLPPNFEGPLLVNRRYVVNATLRFLRRGLWLHASANATSASGNNGDLLTVALGSSTGIISPCDLTVTNVFDGGDSGTWKPGFVIIADASSDILISDAESLTATGYTSVADSGASARNTNVLRYTPTGTSAVGSGLQSLSSLTSTAFSIGVFANIRSNSSTATYSIRPRLINSVTQPVYGPTTVIPTGTGNPTWRFLGVLSRSSNQFYSNFSITTQASAVADSIDIDTFVFVNLSSPTVKVIGLGWAGNMTNAATSSSLITEQRILTRASPQAYYSTNGPNYHPVSLFSTLDIYNAATNIYIVHLGNGSVTSLNFWRTNLSGSVATQTATITRTTGYLTPA